jgi:hypothetical protein
MYTNKYHTAETKAIQSSNRRTTCSNQQHAAATTTSENTDMHISTTKSLPSLSQGIAGSGGGACVGCVAADVVGGVETHKCSSPWPTTPVAATTATTALPALACSQRPVGVVTSESWSLPNIQVKHHENGKSVTDRVFVYLKCLSVGSNRGF